MARRDLLRVSLSRPTFAAQRHLLVRATSGTSGKPIALRPLRYIVYDDIKEYIRRQKLYFRVAFAVVGGASIVVAIVAYRSGHSADDSPAERIKATFVAGSVPEVWTSIDASADIARDALLADIQSLLRPAATRKYGVIIGETGTGKSTLVRQAARTVAAGSASGVVCVDVCDVPKFATDLATVLGVSAETVSLEVAARRRVMHTTKEESSFDPSVEPLATWLRISTPLKEAARLFFLEHHRPMTLVIDGVDALAREQPAFLESLQDFAKTAADSGTLRVVFVSSDKAAVERMKPRSSWSRARKPLEVGDVPDADAVAYLVKRGVSIVTAGEKAYFANLV